MKKINIKELPWKEVLGLGAAIGFAIVEVITNHEREQKFKKMEKFFDSMQSKSEGS